MKYAMGLLLFSSLYAVAPAPLQNYCPVVVVNSTTLPANQLYFVAHGNDPDGIPCFLVPDSNGVCQYAYPTPEGSPSSAGSSKTLSQLPVATGTSQTNPAYLVYMPINSASRAYFSVNKPMYLATALNPALGVLGVSDSSVTSLTDPNYYTLYQDMEFGLVPSTTSSQSLLYLNLSYVDYFCLPMQLTTFSYPSNAPIINSVSTPSGFPTTATMASILTTTNAGLLSGQAGTPAPTTWSNLGLPYYANPYTDATPTTYLRILAAKNSIDLGINPARFQGGLVPSAYFPEDYAENTTYGPVATKSFMDTLYSYYATPNTFTFSIFPANNPQTTYQMTADSATNVLKFTSSTGPSPITIDLNVLTTEQLLSGSVWPFQPTSVNAAYTNEISKLISALFTIGHLPFAGTTSLASPFVNNNDGFAALTYFNNPFSSYVNGPWYNLYNEVLHKQFISAGSVPNNPTLGLAYGYDFDDLLNMSGIINGMIIQDPFGNPPAEQPYVVVELGSLAGTPIPDIASDTYTYGVTVGSAANGVEVSFTYFDGTADQTTTASPTMPTSLGMVTAGPTHPFQINFTFNSITYTYNINLQRQVVTPVSTTSTYASNDQYFQGSVEFTVSGTQSAPTFLISFSSTPPPWPG